MRIKRSKYVSFTCTSSDWQKHIGSVKITNKIFGYSCLTEEYLYFDDDLFFIFNKINSLNWTNVVELPYLNSNDMCDKLVENGFAFYEEPRGRSEAMRVKEILIDESGWKSVSLLCHISNKWKDIHLAVGDYGKLDENNNFVENPKDPRFVLQTLEVAPSHFFHPPNIVSSQKLPNAVIDSAIKYLLKNRRSRRNFLEKKITKQQLSTLLYAGFGAIEEAEIMPSLTVIRKMSPSGGCLHPTECYPLILNVEGVEPGLYHYNVESHALDMILELCELQARDLAQELAAGQNFTRNSSAILLLSTRFERLFWKYSEHAKAYAVAWLDIGHVSQTCFITAQSMGLGLTFIAAISDDNANNIVGLDGINQSVMGALCLGNVPSALRKNLEREFFSREK